MEDKESGTDFYLTEDLLVMIYTGKSIPEAAMHMTDNSFLDELAP